MQNSEKVKLMDICTIKYGKDHKKLGEGNIPAYGTGGIFRYVDQSIHDKKSVLIPRKGTLTNLFLVNPPFWTVDTLFWTDIDLNLVDPDYLYYNLKMKNLGDLNVGTAVPSLTTSILNEVEIDLPSLLNQKEIAKTLICLDNKIEVNKKINYNLLQQAQCLFNSWFVEFEPFGGIAPDNWIPMLLKDVVDFSNGYAFRSKELLTAPEGECYHVFKQGHINRGGGFIPTGTKSWYPRSSTLSLQKYVLQKGDILMAMTDMKDNVAILGNTAIMGVNDQYIVNQRVGILRCNGKFGISYPYISLLTNSNDFLQDLRSRANSGVQVNLSSNEIKGSKVLVAPSNINIKFNNIVGPLFEMMIQNDLENLRLSEIRDVLLPKLMTGELNISEIKV